MNVTVTVTKWTTIFVHKSKKRSLKVSGLSADKKLGLIIENPNHPWFRAAPVHPEFTSTPRDGHPLFAGFVKAAGNSARRIRKEWNRVTCLSCAATFKLTTYIQREGSIQCLRSLKFWVVKSSIHVVITVEAEVHLEGGFVGGCCSIWRIYWFSRSSWATWRRQITFPGKRCS